MGLGAQLKASGGIQAMLGKLSQKDVEMEKVSW